MHRHILLRVYAIFLLSISTKCLRHIDFQAPFTSSFITSFNVFSSCTIHVVRETSIRYETPFIAPNFYDYVILHTTVKLPYNLFNLNRIEFWISIDFDQGNFSSVYNKRFQNKFLPKRLVDFLLDTLMEGYNVENNLLEFSLKITRSSVVKYYA